jgi:hypothetical protein
MRISKDLYEFIALLNSNHVEYLIVGAFAVAWHGYPRYTGDLDILVRPDKQNSERVISTLEQFGFASLGLEADTFEADGAIVQLGVQPNRIDLLTSITGVSFEEAWNARVNGVLDDIRVALSDAKHLFGIRGRQGGRKTLEMLRNSANSNAPFGGRVCPIGLLRAVADDPRRLTPPSLSNAARPRASSTTGCRANWHPGVPRDRWSRSRPLLFRRQT